MDSDHFLNIAHVMIKICSIRNSKAIEKPTSFNPRNLKDAEIQHNYTEVLDSKVSLGSYDAGQDIDRSCSNSCKAIMEAAEEILEELMQ